MKKTTQLFKLRNAFLSMAIAFGSSAKSQNLLTENFSSNSVPASGWSVQGPNQWALYQTNDAGSQIPEMYFIGWNALTDSTKMISPSINTAGLLGVIVEWKHKILKSSNTTATVKLQTTSDGINWHTVWSFSGSGFIGPETKSIAITNSDIGSANFKIAFVVGGTTTPAGSFNSWRIDDIKVDVLNQDASPTINQMGAIIPNQSEIFPRAILKNWGGSQITFDAKYEILDQNNSVVYSSTKSVNNLSGLQTSYVTFDSWLATVGNYSGRVISLYDVDLNHSNDTLEMNFQVSNDYVWKLPLFEVFSSSFCGPCAAVNTNLNALLAQNENKYSAIKYQQNFPPPGDPYFQAAANDRRNYYDIGGIPAIDTNGALVGGSVAFSQFDFNQMELESTQLKINDLQAIYNEDSIVQINGSLLPIINYSAGLKLHAVVVEKVTHNNTGNNTETEFHNVMMAMIPGSSGSVLGALTQNSSSNFSKSINMNTTFVEEMDDLAVVVFVQDDNSKEIIQSKMIDVVFQSNASINKLTNEKIKIDFYPNPADDKLNLNLSHSLTNVEINIIDASGKIVKSYNMNGSFKTMEISDLESGIYQLKISNSQFTQIKKFIKQ